MNRGDLIFRGLVIVGLLWIGIELHRINGDIPYVDNRAIVDTLNNISKNVDLIERKASDRIPKQPPDFSSFR